MRSLLTLGVPTCKSHDNPLSRLILTRAPCIRFHVDALGALLKLFYQLLNLRRGGLQILSLLRKYISHHLALQVTILDG
jgi:hypothetical protein